MTKDCMNCPGWQEGSACVNCLCRKCPVSEKCPGDDPDHCLFDDDGNKVR